MNGKITLILIILAATAILLGSAGFLLPKSEAGGDRYFYQNSAGAVLFDHLAHSEQTDDCAVCHHPMLLSSERIECSMCHDPEMSAEYFDHSDLTEISGHSCVTCHSVNEEIEPQNCRNCHKNGDVTGPAVMSCGTCHDDSYTPEPFTHDDLVNIHGAGCDNCHNAASVVDAYHGQCNRCHQAVAADRFVRKGTIRCNMCHLK